MTAAEIFNWFCKEQNIIPIIRELYYYARPREQRYTKEGIITEYLTLENYMNRKFEQHGMSHLFESLVHSCYYTVGWEKYDEIREKYNIPNIDRKWNYFVKNNIFVKEDCLKIGDMIEYDYRYWGRNGEVIREKRKGKVVSINLAGMTVTLQDIDDKRYNTLCFDNLKESGIELNFYIKRNRKEYYGVDR